MKNIIKSFVALLIVSGMVTTNAFAANPATFTLVANSSSVVIGNTITISVSENGDNVNTVSAKLTYNSSQLQYISGACGAAFAGSIAESNGMTCYTSGGSVVNGSTLVANMTFKALTDTGSSSVTMATNSKIASTDSSTSIWGGGANSVTITSTPAPTSSSSNSTTSSPGAPSSSAASTVSSASTTAAPPTKASPTPADSRTLSSSNSTSNTNGGNSPTGKSLEANPNKPISSHLKNSPTQDPSKLVHIWFIILLPLVIAAGVFIGLMYYKLHAQKKAVKTVVPGTSSPIK